MKKNLLKTIRGMSAYEIIMAMLDGLLFQRSEYVNMGIYGRSVKIYKEDNPTCLPNFFRGSDYNQCVACAATNAIFAIADKKMSSRFIENYISRSKQLGVNEDFLKELEISFDYLRNGEIREYNKRARKLGVATITNSYPHIFLPSILTGNYFMPEILLPYFKLAENQLK